ncbi:hypothetical protein C8Q80DRAFT_1266836 [Daedaleopsis nitida]|nr:hypothetical protein C8Q80DRAFT_1266836 [Daedaleopsis nitida]
MATSATDSSGQDMAGLLSAFGVPVSNTISFNFPTSLDGSLNVDPNLFNPGGGTLPATFNGESGNNTNPEMTIPVTPNQNRADSATAADGHSPLMNVRGQTRPGDPSLEQDLFAQRLQARRMYNTAAASTKQKAQKHGLNPAQIAELMEFIELPPAEMLVDLKIQSMRMENDILHRFLRLFIRHPDTNIRICHTIAAVILAADIPGYFDGIGAQIIMYIEKNVEQFIGLPASCRNDPADWSLVKSVIAIELANIRSATKTKLLLAIKNGLDVYELTAQLLMYDIHPRKEHWGRFAFLRACIERFKREKHQDKKSAMWKFIDQCLREVRQKALDTHPGTDEASVLNRRLFLNQFFVTVLQADLAAYPIKSGGLVRRCFKSDALTDLQRGAEDVAATFVVKDTDPENSGDEEVEGEGDGIVSYQGALVGTSA